MNNESTPPSETAEELALIDLSPLDREAALQEFLDRYEGGRKLVEAHAQDWRLVIRMHERTRQLRDGFDPRTGDALPVEAAYCAEMELLFRLARRFHPLSSYGQSALSKANQCREEYEGLVGPLISKITPANIQGFAHLFSEDFREGIEVGKYSAVGGIRRDKDGAHGVGVLIYENVPLDDRGGRLLVIHWLYVDEQWRSQGVADFLLGELLQAIGSLPSESVSLSIPLQEDPELWLGFLGEWHFRFHAGVSSEFVCRLKDFANRKKVMQESSKVNYLSKLKPDDAQTLIRRYLVSSKYLGFLNSKSLPAGYIDLTVSCFLGNAFQPEALLLAHATPSGSMRVEYMGAKTKEKSHVLSLFCGLVTATGLKLSPTANIIVPPMPEGLTDTLRDMVPNPMGQYLLKAALFRPLPDADVSEEAIQALYR